MPNVEKVTVDPTWTPGEYRQHGWWVRHPLNLLCFPWVKLCRLTLHELFSDLRSVRQVAPYGSPYQSPLVASTLSA